MFDIDAQCAKAIATLDQLTNAATPVEGVPAEDKQKHVHGTLTLKGDEISHAAGIAFVFSKKAGLGLSVSHGSGFILAKLDGKPGWSSPLPFHVTTTGVGVTIGYSEVDTLMVLDSAEAVQEFLKTQVSLDSHLNLSAGSALGANASETALDVRHPGNSFKRFCYSVSHGAMIDGSWNGAGISVKEEDIKQLYGSEARREAVLAGEVQPPPAATRLYAALNRLSFFASNAAAP
jgi:sodium-coupled neutral amino acid transporter 10